MRTLLLIMATACGTDGNPAGSKDVDASAADTSVLPSADDDVDTGSADAETGPTEGATIESVAFAVSEIALVTRPDEARTYRFRLMATWTDGSETRIGEGVEWGLNDIHMGTVDDQGLFTTSTSQGGRVDIIARFGEFVTIGTITVKYVGELVPEGFDVSVFDAPETTSDGTGMLYPSDGAAIPKNQPSMHFQWEDLGASAYRLRFESDVTELTIYSTDLSWISDTELWPVIGESNAGSTVQSTLSGRVGDQVMVKDPQSMVVQDLEAVGSIIYWTPTAQGLMEIPYGSPAESFLTVTETGKCVGCHAVSSAGMVAFTYDGGSAPLGMKTIEERADVIAYDTAGDSNFKVFSPDGSLLLSGLNGTLSLFDGITGSFISNPTIDGASWITHMDWAPDDSYMVFATSSSMSGDYNFTNGSIMRAEHLGGGVFGPAETIISAVDLDPSFGFTNVYYPAVSPDSQWVLFNASTGDSYDDLDATLFVVPMAGGTPIELTQANINSSMANSLPKWAPATAGDDVWWFAFASRRTYGSLTAGNPQIWLSSFDPAEAETGVDPSSAAIWLSNQDSTQNNHIPLWVK